MQTVERRGCLTSHPFKSFSSYFILRHPWPWFQEVWGPAGALERRLGVVSKMSFNLISLTLISSSHSSVDILTFGEQTNNCNQLTLWGLG